MCIIWVGKERKGVVYVSGSGLEDIGGLVAEMVDVMEAIAEAVEFNNNWCPVCCRKWGNGHKGWCWWPALIGVMRKGKAFLVRWEGTEMDEVARILTEMEGKGMGESGKQESYALIKEMEELYAMGNLLWTAEHMADDGKDMIYLVDEEGKIVAPRVESKERVREICERWNAYPILYSMLKGLLAFGPIEEVGGEYVMPETLDGKKLGNCWYCQAKAGGVHEEDCLLVTTYQFLSGWGKIR